MSRARPEPFRLSKTTDGGWYWWIVAANGETLSHSETYTSKAAALKGITSAVVNIIDGMSATELSDLYAGAYDVNDIAKNLTLEVDK